MENLKTTWQNLMSLVATRITLLKFSEGAYDEKWDEGEKVYDEYSLPARVKYDLSEREIIDLGENLKLDAILIVTQSDLTSLMLEIKTHDHFKINDKEFRITKMSSIIIAGQSAGFKIGIKEIL